MRLQRVMNGGEAHMLAGDVDLPKFLSYGDPGGDAQNGVRPDGSNPQEDEHTQRRPGGEALGVREDTAVREALERLKDRMPEGVGVLFCEDPRDVGVSYAQIASVEKDAYDAAGYGDRAEEQGLFDHGFRGYAEHEHSPWRWVIIAKQNAHEGASELQLLAFFNFFGVCRHLDSAYAVHAAPLEGGQLDAQPKIYIVSKLAADPRARRTTVALPGLAVAATLQALADASPYGVFVEAEAQPATQRFVAGHLRRYIPGLSILLNEEVTVGAAPGQEGGAASDMRAPTKLLIHIPPKILEG